MNKHLIISLVAVIIGCGWQASASQVTPAAEPFTVTDALGRSIHFEAPPQRIIVAGKAFFMIADALYLFPGVGERIAATGVFRQGPKSFFALVEPEAAAKMVLEPNVGAEQIAAFHPDAVILKSYLADRLGATLDVLGIPVVYVDLETPAQYVRDLRILGKLLGQPVRAEELVQYYQQRVARIQAAVSDMQKPRVLLLHYSDRDGLIAFQVPPAEWMQTRLVELAGGIPAWRDGRESNGWTTVTLEQIGAWDADALVIVSYFTDPAKVTRTIRTDPNWQAIRAVQTGRVYAFPGDFTSWDQPNPRWILGLTWLAQRLHPDRFAAEDMLTTIQAFYHDLYGLDADVFDAQIRPTLTGDLP